ncbi:recombinase family protein [Labrys miyagiensis]
MPMVRGTIYARYSTDLQNDRSVEDQIALCEKYASRNDINVVSIFHDRARSGASVFGREGLLRLVDAAKARSFDVVIVEALDRLSRDQEDLAGLYKRLSFQGIKIIAVHDGVADPVQIGVRGMLGSLYLADLANKTRRGLQGVIRDGRSAGGRAYGYRPQVGKPGELEIIPEEAEVIRRIFEEYRSGASPRTIAIGLNRDGIPAPRGGRWAACTINGNNKRGNGLLQNPLYAGRLVWNRVRMVRDPDTGRRVSRINPEEEWQTIDVPHFRIVSDDDEADVRARKASNANGPHGPRVHVGKRLLAGLIRCGTCGGSMVMTGSDRTGPRIVCSAHRETHSCNNNSRYYIERVETAVVDHLRRQLQEPELLSTYVAAYREERRSLEARARRDRAKSAKGVADAKAGISRVVDLVADGLLSKDEAAERLIKLRIDRERFERELATAEKETSVIELHPSAVAGFHENLQALDRILKQEAGANVPSELRDLFRIFVAGVTIHPRKAQEPYTFEVSGFLAPFLGEESVFRMVARSGLEPPTRGL